ncbi:MAG: PEP-CTERM system TPR-repeat protein PrsT [Gammaproteobacteria bacterium]|nr:PEP-CTERM system TPR-repeat protein PrsT [Gammaproteobacteria bacterium]
MTAFMTGMARRVGLLLAATLVAAACSSATPEERLERAVGHEAEGRYQAAILELRNALQADPELAEARLLLGLLFLRVGDYLSAVAELERAERLGVEGMELVEALAQARVSSGEERHARRVIADHDGTPPEELSVSLAASLGGALQRVGRTESASTLLRGLVERSPDSAQARLALARLEWSQGRVEPALLQAQAAVSAAPEDQEARMVLGELLLVSGNAEAAQEAFSRAMELAQARGGNLVFAQLGLARALVAARDFDDARPVVESALQAVPNLPAGRYLMALIQLEAGQLEQARESLELVIRDAPDHLASRYFRALINFREGRYERARDDLDRIIARSPENLQARLLLAAVYAEEGAHDRAANVLRFGLRQPGVRPDAAYYAALGQSLMRAGNETEALEMLGRAAAEAPDAAGIRTQLALAYLATGAAGSAEAELREVVDLSESFPLSDTLLILVQLEARRFDEAVASAQRFVERNPDAPMAYNMLGAARLANDNLAAARQAFERALEINEAFVPAIMNLAGMDQQAGDLDAAQARLDRALLANPDSADVRRRLAELLVERGEAGAAADILAALGSHEDMSDQMLAARAQTNLQAGRFDAAVAALEEILRRRPDDQQVALGLAGALAGAGEAGRSLELLQRRVADLSAAPLPILNLYADLLIIDGQYEAAEPVLTAIAGREGGTFPSAMLRGNMALSQGENEAAIGHYARAHRAQPSGDTLRRLQTARARAGRAEEGRADLEAWLQANPDDGGTRALLAELRLDSRDYDGAIREYEDLRELLPNNVVVLNNLAWLYGQTGHPDAVPTARAALELAPDLAPVQDTLGWLLVQQGEVEEGRELLRRAASASPDDAQIQYHYGVALERSGARDEARAALRRALGSGDFDDAEEARALLERLGG